MPDTEKRPWSGQSRGGRLGYLFFILTIKWLGVRVAYAFMALVVIHFIPFAPKATHAIWLYNRRRLGYGPFKSMVRLYRHYYTFGQTLIDKIAIRSGLAGRYRFVFDNYRRFLDIIDHSHGAILIGAHVGCWEAGAAFFGQYGKKIHIVMFDTEHRGIKEAVAQASDGQNFHIIPADHDTLGAMLRIKMALDRSEYVCFNGDRYLDKAASISMPFMGGRARFPVGPFKIAIRCKVPVVFYYAMREKGCTYRFIFEEATVNKAKTTEDLAKQYIESLESIVRKYPQQWFNFYRFWHE